MGNAVITSVFFFLVASWGDWVHAFMAAFAAISVCLAVALGLGILDERQHLGVRPAPVAPGRRSGRVPSGAGHATDRVQAGGMSASSMRSRSM